MSRTARVTFNYVAEQEDELSLEVGAIIRNIKDVDTGWCQGELNGKTGLFPDNFVEEVDITPDVAPASDSVAGKEAKVTFDYEAQDQDELTLKLGDIVHVLGEDEQGWWRGQLGGKRGVFPSNFVEIITDNNVAKPKDTPLDPARKLSEETSPLEKKTTRNEVVDGLHVNDDEESGIKRSSSFGAAAKKLPGGGMGFGNLINPNILAEKKLKNVHEDEKRESKGKTEEAFVLTTKPSKPSLVKTKTPVSSKARPAPPVPLTSPVKKPGERAKVTFAYEPENPDELRLVEGDIVTILNKDTAESDGWWEGEVNGKVGMFPNNFVVLLPSEEDDKAPVPAVDGKKGVLVLPLKDEIIKSPNESDSDATPEHAVSPVRPDKRPPHLATKEQPPSKNAVPSQPIKDESDSGTDVVRPTPGKKPVAPQKPSLPPKKPLPLKSKKPDVAAKKPEKKVVDLDKIVGAKKGGDEAELKDEVRIKPTPDIKSENVDEAPVSFDDAPETETLNHLTANRAKHPQKRPPSKEGRSTNSPRHSLNMEDDHPETIKQPPGRPKEPPKEPAWKREVREAREKKQVADEKAPFPALAHKSDEAHTRASPVQKVEPFATGTPGELDKLRKEVSELREILSKVEKKHGDMIKKLQEEFFREIESLTNDLDEEKKKNAAEHASHKVEIERLKRRQTRFNLEETQ
ncbi:CD2-associated protein-like [Montipora capricornis]|uniref:CD2-associated protein-like n=1 Tax=Montipora capricornis TaxID=246305 RepID=UPI0035F1D657